MLNPEHERRPLEPSGKLFIALGIVSILASVFFFLTYSINRASCMRYEYEGRDVTAQVEGLGRAMRPWTLRISYQYTDEQGVVRHSSDIYPFPDDKDVKIGQPIDIIYYAPSPDQSRIARRQAMMMKEAREAPWTTIALLALGGFLSIVIGTWRKH